MDPLDDDKSGIERPSSTDEKEETRLKSDIECSAGPGSDEKAVDAPPLERPPGPLKRRAAYFQALCDDLKNKQKSKTAVES